MRMKPGATLVAAVLSLFLVSTAGCDAGPSERERALQAEVARLKADRDSAAKRSEELGREVSNLKSKNADLLKWATELKADYEEAVTSLRAKADSMATQIADLRGRIDGLDAPTAAEETGPASTEDLAGRITVARRALERLGLLLYRGKEYAGARDALLIARHLGASDPAMLLTLARASALTGSDEAAGENYKLALAALEGEEEKDVDTLKVCLLNYGAVLRRLEEPGKAAELWKRAVDLDGNFAAAHYNLGLVYAQDLDEPGPAIEALRRHVACGGRRSASARDLIKKLQARTEGTQDNE